MAAYKNTFNSATKLPLCITPNGPVARGRVQNVSDRACFVQAGASNSVAPDFSGAMQLLVGGGFDAGVPLSDLFPDLVATDATTHLWVQSAAGLAVAVSYA